MSIHPTRPGIPVQAATPVDCRHSRAAFHCAFAPIAERRDLSDAAKLLHAGLVSMARQGLRWTQAEIAERLGWAARQKVWRAASELVAAGLLRVKRLGLGLPNEYHLAETDDLSAEDIKARAPKSPSVGAGHQEVRPANAPARARSFDPKNPKRDQRTGAYDTKDFTQTRYGKLPDPCSRCGSRLHATREHGPTPSR